MSILVKGLKIPTNCGECKFFAWERGVGNHCAIDESITFHATLDGLDVRWEKNGNCPLVELPPHGDLIDKNHISELLDTDRHNRNIYQLVWNDAINTVIQTMPTIVEAEQ